MLSPSGSARHWNVLELAMRTANVTDVDPANARVVSQPQRSRPQRWSRSRKAPVYQAPTYNFYAQSLAIFLGLAGLTCGLACFQATIKRCAGACSACLAARALAAAARAECNQARDAERSSLVYGDMLLSGSGVPEPDVDGSAAMEIDAL